MRPVGGEFATARRGITPEALKLAHDIIQRSGFQAAEAATGIAQADLRRRLPPPAPRAGYRPPETATPPAPVHAPLRFVPPTDDRHAPRVTAREIIAEVAALHRLHPHDLTGPNRRRRCAWPRQHAYAEVRRRCPHLSLPQIGQAFGGRDHTTVLHGIRAHEARAEVGEA